MAGPIIFVLLYLLISSLSQESRASRRTDREERQLRILIKEEEEKVKKRWANQGKTDDGKDLPSDPDEYWRIFQHEIKQVQKSIYVPSQQAIENSLLYGYSFYVLDKNEEYIITSALHKPISTKSYFDLARYIEGHQTNDYFYEVIVDGEIRKIIEHWVFRARG